MTRVRALVAGLLATACGTTTTTDRLHLPPLRTVPQVDLGRYLGTWYEIASFPQRFQRGCTATTATYTLRGDGDIDVVNRCRKDSPDGPEKVARGLARVVDRASNAKLEVSFFRPFWGDYWIVELADDYGHAVVGHPSRDYLWILARAPVLAPDVYESILRKLSAQGYETGRLVRTVHRAEASGASAPQPTARFERTLRLGGVEFRVACANDSSLNFLEIVPAGLERDAPPIVRKVDGTVTGAEVADLDGDGSPELYVFVTSAGSGSYGSLVAYAANARRSVSEIFLPPLGEGAAASKGYRGHDAFAVEGSRLVRRFPLYRDGDPNAGPTGGSRRLEYALVRGEAGWVLRLERTADL